MSQNQHVYRIDKFKVPFAAEADFLARAMQAREVLRRQPGLVEARLLKQSGGPGVFNFVSIAVWESPAAVAQAREAMLAHQKASGVDVETFRAQRQIEADIATYEEVGA